MLKQCALCQKDTNNSRFCSRPCAAKLTNKESIKRKRKIKYCISCTAGFLSRGKICLQCKLEKLEVNKRPLSCSWIKV